MSSTIVEGWISVSVFFHIRFAFSGNPSKCKGSSGRTGQVRSREFDSSSFDFDDSDTDSKNSRDRYLVTASCSHCREVYRGCARKWCGLRTFRCSDVVSIRTQVHCCSKYALTP